MGGTEANDTDHGAIECGHDPALREFLANEHGSENVDKVWRRDDLAG